MVGLPPGDSLRALGLADFKEVLAGQLDRGFVALGAGGAEPGAGKAARFVLQDDLGKVLGGLVGEGAGVGIGHGGGLATDCLGNAAVTVAEAGDGRPAGCVDDRVAVFGEQIDAFAADGDWRDGAGAMQDTGHRRNMAK